MGEPITKQSYTIDNSITHSGGFFCKSKKNKKWLQDNDFIDIDGKMKKAHDAATNFNGQAWRTPTPSEMKELISRCTWYIGTRNNVPGYKVVGPNGNSIFLPCTGRKDGNKTIDQYSGTYLTSMIPEDDSSGNYAWALYFDDKKHSLKGVKRYFGSVIRPVYIQ